MAESHSYESMPPVAAGVHIWFQPFDDVTGRLARVDFVPNKNAGPLDPEIDVERDILPLIGISKQRIVSRSSVLIDRKAAQEITDAILRNYVSRGHYNRHCFMRHVDLKFSFMQVVAALCLLSYRAIALPETILPCPRTVSGGF